MKRNHIFLFFLFFLSVILVYVYLPVDELGPRRALPAVGLDWNNMPALGLDWRVAFRPALLQFPDVYSLGKVYNPPWAFLPLLPVALLSPGLGTTFLFMLNLFCWIFVAHRFELSPLYFVVFLFFSNVFVNCWVGNIEGLVALGLILPPPIGILFLLAKPQFGGAVVLFWLVESYRTGGLQAATRLALPAVVVILVSFVLFGFWPSHVLSLPGREWNVSVFPWGVPFGAALLMLAFHRRDIRFAMMASPFFSPYLARYTWAIVWFGFLLILPEFEILRRRLSHVRFQL